MLLCDLMHSDVKINKLNKKEMRFKKQFKEELINKNVWYCLEDVQIESIASIFEQQLQLYLVSYRRKQLIALLKYYENKPLTIGLEKPELLVDKFIAITR